MDLFLNIRKRKGIMKLAAFIKEDLSFTWDILKFVIVAKAAWLCIQTLYKCCFSSVNIIS